MKKNKNQRLRYDDTMRGCLLFYKDRLEVKHKELYQSYIWKKFNTYYPDMNCSRTKLKNLLQKLKNCSDEAKGIYIEKFKEYKARNIQTFHFTYDQRDLFLNLCKTFSLDWENVSKAMQMQISPDHCKQIYDALTQDSSKEPEKLEEAEKTAFTFDFTLEQKDLFLNLCKIYKMDWEKISKDFHQETQMQISPDHCKEIYQAIEKLEELA
jgi:hypothetical protein